jgi:hypothetical protein
MPTCDEDDCAKVASAVCPTCGVMLCDDHRGADRGSDMECPDDFTPMDEL